MLKRQKKLKGVLSLFLCFVLLFPTLFTQPISAADTDETIDVKISVSWDDNDNTDGYRPGSLVFNVYGDTIPLDENIEVTAEERWTKTKSLPKYNSNGEIINYEVKPIEDGLFDDSMYTYTDEKEVDEDGNYSFGFKCIHELDMECINIVKKWDDNNDADGVRPDAITVNLMIGNEVYKTVKVTKNTNWETSIAFPAVDNGIDIMSSVEPVEVPVDGYTSSIKTEGKSGPEYVEITNTRVPEEKTDENKTISVTVKKVWDDENNKDKIRPDEIKVCLLNDGKQSGEEITLNSKNKWSYTFDNLPSDGKYSVKEVTIPDGYAVSYSGDASKGYTITNKHTPDTISISGKKTWKDGNDSDRIRPDSITVNLLANGEKIDSKKVTKDDDWTYTFSNLAKESDGKEIVYTITEDKVDGYTTKYDGYNITNTHKPEKATEDTSSDSTETTESDTNTKDSDTPTGDNTNTGLYILLLTAAFAGLIGFGVYAKNYMKIK